MSPPSATRHLGASLELHVRPHRRQIFWRQSELRWARVYSRWWL